MKSFRLALAWLLLLSGINMQAGVVTEQEALQKAQQFMQGKNLNHRSMRRAPQKEATSQAYYVFNVENDGGFVIVAGDDRMKDILGYSDKGHVNMDKLPDNLKWLLDYYAQIAHNPSDTTLKTIRASTDRPELQPLVTTQWDQWAPYNTQCPEINDQIPPTGCVATAMAQVINYFQWPISNVRSVAAYTS